LYHKLNNQFSKGKAELEADLEAEALRLEAKVLTILALPQS
jgi:hypothetical protein